jgi:hypothetical protein
VQPRLTGYDAGMNPPRPAAVILATGLAETTVGTLVAMLGGVWLWIGLIIGLVGAWFVILGMFRVTQGVDYLVHAAKPAPVKTTA